MQRFTEEKLSYDLLKLLKSFAKENVLNIEQVVSNALICSIKDEIDLSLMIKNQMINRLAQEMITESSFEYTESFDDQCNKKFRAQVFAFSSKELTEFITTIYIIVDIMQGRFYD